MLGLEDLMYGADRSLSRNEILDMERAQRMTKYRREEESASNSTPVDDVESWLDDNPDKRCENKPNGGIIRATKAVHFVDAIKPDMTVVERKKARQQAQKEHRQALRNLRAAEHERPSKYLEKRAAAEARRAILKERLDSGERIEMVNGDKEMFQDMDALRRHGANIVLVTKLSNDEKFYVLDTFEEAQIDKLIETNHNKAGVTERLVEIFKTNKLVRANNFKSGPQSRIVSLRHLSKVMGKEIYRVKSRTEALSWICLE